MGYQHGKIINSIIAQIFTVNNYICQFISENKNLPFGDVVTEFGGKMDYTVRTDMAISEWTKGALTERKLIMGEQLTQSDVKKIQEEIDYRKLVVRKEAIEAVKEARAQGDLSENFEYYAAKRDKNKNESRIRYLERMLKNATIVSDVSKTGEAGMNNFVEVYFEDDDETERYKLVTSIRGNSLDHKISIESPLGKAILGRHEGDRVFVKINDNAGYYIQIKKIEDTTDDEADAIRSF